MADSKYTSILSSKKINGVEFKNRIMMAPMGDNLCELDGSISPKQYEYFKKRARGGCGAIILGSVGVSRIDGQVCEYELSLANDGLIDGYKKFTQEMHEYGCKIIAQLKHGGSISVFAAEHGFPFLVPTKYELSEKHLEDYKTTFSTLTKKEMEAFILRGADKFKEATTGDIQKVVNQFKDAAIRAHQAGMDGVEIHAGHGYLVSGFLSRSKNSRLDEYGGSVENRARLLLEIIAAIKEHLPSEFPILVRLDAEEIDIKNGITIEESVELSKILQSAGVDAIHVSTYANPALGTAFTLAPIVHAKEGFLKATQQIRKATNIPIIAVGRVDPDRADALINQKDFDFIAMGRNLLADPELPNKLSKNKSSSIKPCQYSYECVSRIFLNGQMVCASDTSIGDDKLELKPKYKELTILGAGPAGMETAIQAAKRNIPTTIYERRHLPGGNLIGSALVYKPYRELLRYYINELDSPLINVKLESSIDHENITSSDHINAVGGDIVQTSDDEIHIARWIGQMIDEHGCNFDKLESSIRNKNYKSVLIKGVDTIELHLANFLQSFGVKVTLLQLDGKEIGQSMPVVLRWRVLDQIKANTTIIKDQNINQDADLILNTQFIPRDDMNDLQSIGDAKNGLSFIPKATKEARNIVK